MARRRRHAAAAGAIGGTVAPPPWVALPPDVDRALRGAFLGACAAASCVPLPLADEKARGTRDRLAGNATVTLWAAARYANEPALRREATEAGCLALWQAGVRSLAFAVERPTPPLEWPHRLSPHRIAAGLPEWDARRVGLCGGELALHRWLADLIDHAQSVGVALPVDNLEPLTV